MRVDTFMKFLSIVVLAGLGGSALYAFGWRSTVRKGKIPAGLGADLRRKYLEACKWLMRHRWVLVLFAVGVVVSQIDHFVMIASARGSWSSNLVPPPIPLSTSFRGLLHQFTRWETYVSRPLSLIPLMITPFRVGGWTSVGGFVLVLGLWRFWRYVKDKGCPEELERSFRLFGRTLTGVTVVACLILAGLIVYCAVQGDAEQIWKPQSPAWLVWSVGATPFWILASTACSALFVSALLGTFLAHLKGETADPLHVLALGHYEPLYLTYLIFALLFYMLGTFLALAQRFVPHWGAWSGLYVNVYLLVSSCITLSLLFAPAAIVAHGLTWQSAIKRSLRFWRSQPGPTLTVIACFAALAFVLQTVLTFTLGLFGRQWIVSAGLRQWIELVFQTSVLLGMYLFYISVSQGPSPTAP